MNIQKNGLRRQAIYEFICSYTKEKGYAPSVREIGAAVGLRSPSTVHTHLKTLQKEGLILIDPHKPRTIGLPKTDNFKNTETDRLSEDISKEVYGSGTIQLPLLGQIAAGTPILAEQNIEEYLTLPSAIADDRASYVLRVRGDSMIEAGILDGDYLVIREIPEAQNGDIVAALIEDEATVKTFYKEEDTIRLQPQNHTMSPIYVKNPKILGKVTAVLRSLS